MASSKLCAGQVVAETRAILTLAGGDLPPDAVFEILLRLPGRDLCRLRAVCRPWRSLLSDPAFAAAHHTSNNGVLYDILDLSGRVVRRVNAAATTPTENEWVASTGLGLVCVAEGAGVSCRLLDPAAAARVAFALPRGLAEDHAAHERDISHHTAMVALGQVGSTGERKVLRVLHLFPDMARQLYEIITLDGGDRCRWRKAMDPAHTVGLGTWTAIDGVVYFFSSEFIQGQDVMPDRIASFDLETEEWRPTIRGPRRGYGSRSMSYSSVSVTSMVNMQFALCWCWMMGG
nr:F-box/LRR-repeat protein At2g43260-like [Setaria viridis]